MKELARALKKFKIKVAEMHSDLDQNQREDVMLDFKAGKINVVVATDIISRGIDIDNIETVINYDVPHEAEDYVHRIGRTARADKEGSAYTFISEKERSRFRNIEKLLEKEVEKLEVPENLGETPSYGAAARKGGAQSGGRSSGRRNTRQYKKSADSRPKDKRGYHRHKKSPKPSGEKPKQTQSSTDGNA